VGIVVRIIYSIWVKYTYTRHCRHYNNPRDGRLAERLSVVPLRSTLSQPRNLPSPRRLLGLVCTRYDIRGKCVSAERDSSPQQSSIASARVLLTEIAGHDHRHDVKNAYTAVAILYVILVIIFVVRCDYIILIFIVFIRQHSHIQTWNLRSAEVRLPTFFRISVSTILFILEIHNTTHNHWLYNDIMIHYWLFTVFWRQSYIIYNHYSLLHHRVFRNYIKLIWNFNNITVRNVQRPVTRTQVHCHIFRYIVGTWLCWSLMRPKQNYIYLMIVHPRCVTNRSTFSWYYLLIYIYK